MEGDILLVNCGGLGGSLGSHVSLHCPWLGTWLHLQEDLVVLVQGFRVCVHFMLCFWAHCEVENHGGWEVAHLMAHRKQRKKLRKGPRQTTAPKDPIAFFVQVSLFPPFCHLPPPQCYHTLSPQEINNFTGSESSWSNPLSRSLEVCVTNLFISQPIKLTIKINHQRLTLEHFVCVSGDFSCLRLNIIRMARFCHFS